MKKSAYLLILFVAFQSLAQPITTEQIIDGYLQNTGGKARWIELRGIAMQATIMQENMEIPIEIVQLADHRTYTKFTVGETDYFSNVYDGETLWGMNFQTRAAERADEESLKNFKLDLNDFPDSFLFYKRNGYQTEYQGVAMMEGRETYQVKLTKEPRLLRGTTIADITYYFFDTETLLPIAQKAPTQIEGATQMSMTLQSDYREIGGYYFPFVIKQGLEGEELNTITIKHIEIDPEVDASVFEFPGDR